MKAETRQTTVYVASDGKEFLSESECAEHETVLKDVVYFPVRLYPDLTEGRHGPKHVGCIAVNARGNHAEFAEYAAYEIYGNKITFVQGVFSSNAITRSWSLGVGMSEPDVKVVATVQERFVSKNLFGEGLSVTKQK